MIPNAILNVTDGINNSRATDDMQPYNIRKNSFTNPDISQQSMDTKSNRS
jgi:hypothetical protein